MNTRYLGDASGFRSGLRPLAAGFGLAVATMLLSIPSPAHAQASFEAQWAELVAAAKKEGSLMIASGGAPSRQYRPTVDAFQKKFGIKTQVSTGNANDTVNRVLAERKAGRYTMDLTLISIRVNN